MDAVRVRMAAAEGPWGSWMAGRGSGAPRGEQIGAYASGWFTAEALAGLRIIAALIEERRAKARVVKESE